MIVTVKCHDAAMFGGSGQVGVAQDVAGAIHARTFAVPPGHGPVILALPGQIGLLRSPRGSSRQVFVNARLKDDIVGVQQLADLPQRTIVVTQRGTSIPGDETRSPAPVQRIPTRLRHRQAHKGLDAIHIGHALIANIFVVE